MYPFLLGWRPEASSLYPIRQAVQTMCDDFGSQGRLQNAWRTAWTLA